MHTSDETITKPAFGEGIRQRFGFHAIAWPYAVDDEQFEPQSVDGTRRTGARILNLDPTPYTSYFDNLFPCRGPSEPPPGPSALMITAPAGKAANLAALGRDHIVGASIKQSATVSAGENLAQYLGFFGQAPQQIANSDVAQSLKRLEQFKAWHANWDGEGAPAPDVDTINAAKDLLNLLRPADRCRVALDAFGHPMIMLSNGDSEAEIFVRSASRVDFTVVGPRIDVARADFPFKTTSLPAPLRAALISAGLTRA